MRLIFNSSLKKWEKNIINHGFYCFNKKKIAKCLQIKFILLLLHANINLKKDSYVLDT